MTDPSPSEAELKEAIRQVNHGGIDSDGSTDTDRLYLIFTHYSKQQGLVARIEELKRFDPRVLAECGLKWYVENRMVELRNLSAQEGGEG